MNIYLIRHGRQCSNLCNVDVELSPEGHRQAQLVAKRLKNYQIEGLYASALIRAQQTAEHIKEELHLPIHTIAQIAEIDFGDWTGKEDAYLNTQFAAQRHDYAYGLSDIRYPNGESGESCYLRFKEGMEQIVLHAKAHRLERIAVVTHGIAMRAFLCGTFAIPFAKRGILARSLENTSITELEVMEDGTYTLERFNDYSHIEPYDELLRKHFK